MPRSSQLTNRPSFLLPSPSGGTRYYKGIGPKSLQELISAYRQLEPNKDSVHTLEFYARSSKDLRVRRGALLLLDRFLERHSELRVEVKDREVKKALRLLQKDRPGETKNHLFAILPKTDLHVHPDGSKPVEKVIEQAEKQNIDLATVLTADKANPIKGPALQDVEDLQSYPSLEEIRRLSQITAGQPDFFKMLILGFDFAVAVMQTQEALFETAYDLVEDSYYEGVMHLTAIYAPCLHTAGGLSYAQQAEAIIRGLQAGQKQFGVTWELAPAIYRGVYTKLFPGHPALTVQLIKELAPKFPGQIAIDVVGMEDGAPLADHAEEYRSLRHEDVIIRGHVGEMLGTGFNMMTALKFGLRRFGHGIRFFDLKPDQRDRILAADVTFEVSPVSNDLCHSIAKGNRNRLANHQLKKMLATDARIALCTDDRTVMATDHLRQMQALEEAGVVSFFEYGHVSVTAERIIHGSISGIGNSCLVDEYSQQASEIVAGLNELLEIIGPVG